MLITATQRSATDLAHFSSSQMELLQTQEFMATATPGQFFALRYAQIDKVVPYRCDWADEGGYFFGAMHDATLASQLKAGSLACCSDHLNRPMIFVGTDWGVIVVFQRYSGDNDSIVAQLPHALSRHLKSCLGLLSVDELRVLLGDHITSNIGVV